jgi:hypothetical protein
MTDAAPSKRFRRLPDGGGWPNRQDGNHTEHDGSNDAKGGTTMAIHGTEYWGLHFVATMAAAYAIVLLVALAVVGLRRLGGRDEAHEGARSFRPSDRVGRNSALR